MNKNKSYSAYRWLKRSILPVVVLVILVVVAVQSANNASSLKKNRFRPESVVLFHHRENVWIFRGNVPVSGQTLKVTWPALVRALKTTAARAGHPLPGHFRVADVSLLSKHWPLHEAVQNRTEQEFFKARPAKGSFINIPVPVTHRWHYDFDASLRAAAAIRHLTRYASPAHPVVVYVHCEHGVNRTGTVLGVYGIRYLHLKPEEAIHAVLVAGVPVGSRGQYTIHRIGDNELYQAPL